MRNFSFIYRTELFKDLVLDHKPIRAEFSIIVDKYYKMEMKAKKPKKNSLKFKKQDNKGKEFVPQEFLGSAVSVLAENRILADDYLDCKKMTFEE